MISALFNLLCVASFASFGLTCTLLHKLCCKRCGRRYPALENVPCPCEKYTRTRKSASVCTNTSNSLQNINNRRSSINGTRKPILTCTDSNCNSDIAVDSRNTCMLRKNGIKQDDDSYFSKCKETAPVSINLSYNSDIFNKFTISSTNSDLSNNISICINSCLNKSNVKQSALKNSCKNTSTCTAEEMVKSNKNIEPHNASRSSSCSERRSMQTNSCCPSDCSEISDLIDQFQDNIQLDEMSESITSLNLCCILKRNSNMEQSDSTYPFTDSSNSAIINLMRPIYCKCGRNMNSDEDSISNSYNIIQCKPKADSFRCGDSEDISALNKEASDDLDDFLVESILKENVSLNSLQSNLSQRSSNQSACICYSEQDEKKYLLNNNRIKIKNEMNLSSNVCRSNCCKYCDCGAKNINPKCDETFFNFESISSNENIEAIASRICESKVPTTNSIKNIKSSLCSDVCHNDCCTKCSCEETTVQTNSRRRFQRTGNEECQKSCCSQCDCTQTVASNIYRKISNAANQILSTKYNSACVKNCCSKCSCTPTVASNIYKKISDATGKILSRNWRDEYGLKNFDTNRTSSNECEKNCCSECSCTKTVASNIYRKISDDTNKLLSTKWSDESVIKCTGAPQTNSRTRNKNSLCSNECQTDCCTKCTCSQTTSAKVYEKKSVSTNCSNKCVKNCCTKCNCTQTIAAQILKPNLCSLECQTDCCTKCNCTQTKEMSKCKRDCEKDCCTQCNCSQTVNIKNAKLQTGKSKSNFCSDECQTDCCTKCNCAQTIETSSCKKDCCTKCDCSQTLSSKNAKLQIAKSKSNFCSDECQTDCCTKCSCAQTIETSSYKKDCCTNCSCSQTLNSKNAKLQIAKSKSNFCSDECQTDCCTKCSCAQTTETSNCKKDCCTKCDCSQTLSSKNAKLQIAKSKSNFCCNECQTDCCTKCSCAQTTESSICKKDCCTKCNCSQTVNSKNAKLQIAKSKSNFCSDECQTDCCTKCRCAQTTETSNCKKDCCTKCSCSQTLNSRNAKLQIDKSKSNFCCDECQTDCCTNCNCSQTTEANTIKCMIECQKDCCTNCDCGQTTESFQANLQTETRAKSNLCSNECRADCCTECNCVQTTNSRNSLATDYSESSTTMTMKRRRVKRKCCNPSCDNTNDAVLVKGDIKIKDMTHKPIKYVFQTEESDNTVRIHELSLNIKPRGSQVSLDNILGKYLLKLKVNS